MTTPTAVLEVIAGRKHTSAVYENLTDADLARELIDARKDANFWMLNSAQNKVDGFRWMEKADNLEKQLTDALAKVTKLQDKLAGLGYTPSADDEEEIP